MTSAKKDISKRKLVEQIILKYNARKNWKFTQFQACILINLEY